MTQTIWLNSEAERLFFRERKSVFFERQKARARRDWFRKESANPHSILLGRIVSDLCATLSPFSPPLTQPLFSEALTTFDDLYGAIPSLYFSLFLSHFFSRFFSLFSRFFSLFSFSSKSLLFATPDITWGVVVTASVDSETKSKRPNRKLYWKWC